MSTSTQISLSIGPAIARLNFAARLSICHWSEITLKRCTITVAYKCESQRTPVDATGPKYMRAVHGQEGVHAAKLMELRPLWSVIRFIIAEDAPIAPLASSRDHSGELGINPYIPGPGLLPCRAVFAWAVAHGFVADFMDWYGRCRCRWSAPRLLPKIKDQNMCVHAHSLTVL